MKALALYLLCAAGALAFTQSGNTSTRAAADRRPQHAPGEVPAQSPSIKATDEQRMSFAYCMSATNIVHKLAGRIVSRNRHWPYNPKVFAGQKEQLQSSVADMIEVHRRFLETLSHDQAQTLNKNLTEMDLLQSELNAGMAQIDKQWASSKPDAQSIAASVYEIGKIADEWRFEHNQIARAINLFQ